jgi:enterochelin esterase-like enzyme
MIRAAFQPLYRGPAAVVLGLTAFLAFGSVGAADSPQAAAGTLKQITVHGSSLVGNLSGDSADRTVFVYLPPSYATARSRRYPVLYDLHGYTLTAERWVGILKAREAIDRAIAAGNMREMIVVFPDAMSVHDGSMYSSSVTTGDWDTFIAHDLVKYIDGHYRTLARRESRGLSGHSMGGYGAFRIGMKHPDVFSVLYPMSSCCLSPRGVTPADAALEQVKTVADAVQLQRGARPTLAASAAWAPDPQNPPFYLDLPTQGGMPDPSVLARYAANAPNAMLPQYVPNLKKYRAIQMDVGLQDPLFNDNKEMDRLLSEFSIPHTYETYEGNHVNHIPERFEQNVLPFFSKHLEFGSAK